jgi:glycine/D-amino acid oxidase-like deaminating enzyme
LLRRARERGLRVFDRTEVHGWRKRGRAFQLTIAGGHHVRARAIVIAAGYEAQRYVSRRLTAMHSTYAIVSKPLESFPGWPERALVWETARPYNYLRTTADNRAIIGGFDVPFRDPAQRDALLPAKARALERKFRRLLPKIDFERAYAWTGTFAETKDGLPFIGPSADEPAVLFALGYGGNGITFGVIAAEIVRDRILERPNASAPLFSFDRQRLRA